MKVLECTFCLSLFFYDILIAQYVYHERHDIVVQSVGGTALLFPWTGGLNAPQFSEMDVNKDDINDLFIFDRRDERATIFISDGGAGVAGYSYFKHPLHFLPSLNSWLLIRDFNCDGIEDIFTYSLGYGGAKVYMGSYNAMTGWSYSLFKTIVQYPGFSGLVNIYIYIPQSDIPSLTDMDNDGDIDLLIGTTDGKIIFLENTASSGFPMSFAAPISNAFAIDVGNNCAPQLIDVDEDGLNDLIIGEIQGRIFYYRNTGTAASPAFTLIDNQWGDVEVRNGITTGYAKPLLTKALSGESFDLIIGTESGKVFHYNNISGNIAGTFTLVDSNMIDYERSKFSAPCMADIDNDT